MPVYSYENYFFLFFSLLALISLILIVYSNREIYSILFLIVFFLNISCMLLVLKIEFISSLIILIYISAITIFFLFIIMTTNLKINNKTIKLKIIEFFSLIIIISIILALNFDSIFNYFTPGLSNKISPIYVNFFNHLGTTEKGGYNHPFAENFDGMLTLKHLIYNNSCCCSNDFNFYSHYIFGPTNHPVNSTYFHSNWDNSWFYFDNYIEKLRLVPRNLDRQMSLKPDFFNILATEIPFNGDKIFFDLEFSAFYKNSPYYFYNGCVKDYIPYIAVINNGKITVYNEYIGNTTNPFVIDEGFKPWFCFEYYNHKRWNETFINKIINGLHKNDFNFSLFNDLKLKNVTKLPDIIGIYSNMEFHSIFYNFFIIELLSVGFILLITLMGVVVLTTNRRRNNAIDSPIEKLNHVFKLY